MIGLDQIPASDLDHVQAHFAGAILQQPFVDPGRLRPALDAKHIVIRDFTVSQGSLTVSIVHPREVFNLAVRESAAAIIFVHNHPSGDPQPSEEDHALTQRLMEAGEILGIRVLDHVVIGDGKYVSFADEGFLRFDKQRN